MTALQAAAKCGNIDVVERLINCSADVNAEPSGDSGETALSDATFEEDLRIVELLVGSGADARCITVIRYLTQVFDGKNGFMGALLFVSGA